jgi:hypothetical protein
MPKRSVTMRRKAPAVTITETLGHDAEITGHDRPKYPSPGCRRTMASQD